MPLFTAEVVAELDRAYAWLPVPLRPPLWHVAHDDRWAARRSWLDGEWDHLPAPSQQALRSALLDSDSFAAAASELALVRVLRRAGLEPVLSPPLNGQTPDVWVAATPGQPDVIFEVWTRSVPKRDRGQAREWSALLRAVSGLPRPLALTVEPLNPDTPLIPPTPAAVAADVGSLNRWAMAASTGPGSTGTFAGVVLRVIGERPPGASGGAVLHVPIIATQATSQMLIEQIGIKVRRYRKLARARSAALVVVLAGEEQAGLDVDLLADTLAGKNVMALTFDVMASGIVAGTPAVTLRHHESPPVFDAALSAVGWLDVLADEPTLTLWDHNDGAIAAPQLPQPLPGPQPIS